MSSHQLLMCSCLVVVLSGSQMFGNHWSRWVDKGGRGGGGRLEGQRMMKRQREREGGGE